MLGDEVGTREPRIMQVALPDINTMVTPMSSVTVKKSLTTGEYSYELKLYFATPEEAVSDDALAMMNDFDQRFYACFPKPIKPEKPEKGEKGEKGERSARGRAAESERE